MDAALAAAARSASSQMIIGAEPPSSSVTRLEPTAASAATCPPTGVGHVNAIWRPRAPELQRHALGADRGQRRDLLAPRRGAGERDLAHQRVAHERVAGHAA